VRFGEVLVIVSGGDDGDGEMELADELPGEVEDLGYMAPGGEREEYGVEVAGVLVEYQVPPRHWKVEGEAEGVRSTGAARWQESRDVLPSGMS
jgi:hypothetical protein